MGKARAADLRLAMSASAKGKPVPAPEENSVEKPARKAAAQSWPENPHYRPSRVDKNNVTGYFPPAVKKQLRILAAENETTIQELLAEALNDLFAKYGKPEIAPVERPKSDNRFQETG